MALLLVCFFDAYPTISRHIVIILIMEEIVLVVLRVFCICFLYWHDEMCGGRKERESHNIILSRILAPVPCSDVPVWWMPKFGSCKELMIHKWEAKTLLCDWQKLEADWGWWGWTLQEHLWQQHHFWQMPWSSSTVSRHSFSIVMVGLPSIKTLSFVVSLQNQNHRTLQNQKAFCTKLMNLK